MTGCILYEDKKSGEDGFYETYPSMKEVQETLDQFIWDGLDTEYIESLKVANLMAVRSVKIDTIRTVVIGKPK